MLYPFLLHKSSCKAGAECMLACRSVLALATTTGMSTKCVAIRDLWKAQGKYTESDRYEQGDGMEQLLQVGVISSTHGVRGEVKVYPTTDDVNRFKKLKKVILDTGKEQKELEIQSVKFFKQMVILKFKGIDNINDIEKYKGKSLYVTREHAVKLKKDEYFIADLIDMQVLLDDGSEFVYCIQNEKYGEVLVPAIGECIRQVDVENKKMIIHLIPGLVEEI